MPSLGLFCRVDELGPAEGVDTGAGMNPSRTWILYAQTWHDSMNDSAPGFHGGAADDAQVRIRRFLAEYLPQPVVPAY